MPIDLLPVGTKIPRAAVELEHEDYQANIEDWKFWRHAYDLTGGFKPMTETYTRGGDGLDSLVAPEESYIVPYQKEDDVDWRRRVHLSTPPRFVIEGVTHLSGVLTQQDPNRSGYPEKLSQWLPKVTPKGHTWQQWIATEVVPMVEIYDHVYCFFSRPDVGGETLAVQEQALEAEGLPEVIARIIVPENLPWWNTDSTGRMIECRFTELRHEEKPDPKTGLPVDSEEITIHWWITLSGWMAARDTGSGDLEVSKAGYWNSDAEVGQEADAAAAVKPMANLPVVKWALGMPGPTEQAALAMLAYFQLDSALKVLEESTCFPMPYIPVLSAMENPAEVVKGPGLVGTFPHDGAHTPILLEPAGHSVEYISKVRLPALEAAAMAPYGRQQQQAGGSDSGVALAHMQEQAINIYRKHATAHSQAEFEALQPVAELFGEEMPPDARVEWPKDSFGALDDVQQGETLTAFREMEPGPDYEERAIRAMAEVALPPMTDAEHKKAIEAWKKDKEKREAERKAFEAENDDLQDDDDPFSRPAATNPTQMGGGENDPTATPEPVG